MGLEVKVGISRFAIRRLFCYLLFFSTALLTSIMLPSQLAPLRVIEWWFFGFFVKLRYFIYIYISSFDLQRVWDSWFLFCSVSHYTLPKSSCNGDLPKSNFLIWRLAVVRRFGCPSASILGSSNLKKGGKLIGVDMVLLDQKLLKTCCVCLLAYLG